MTGNNEIMLFEEVMEYLNVGKNTLYRLLKSGEIHAFKIGKAWKIPRKSVEEYINQALTDNGRTYKNKMET
ncbi:MAG: helix-turn-helix domain-containing protein [Oscillospiraceae bacterium]|nr:helix-turn-helix domain-containing protein [Oscillospiraceae bacterium]